MEENPFHRSAFLLPESSPLGCKAWRGSGSVWILFVQTRDIMSRISNHAALFFNGFLSQKCPHLLQCKQSARLSLCSARLLHTQLVLAARRRWTTHTTAAVQQLTEFQPCTYRLIVATTLALISPCLRVQNDIVKSVGAGNFPGFRRALH